MRGLLVTPCSPTCELAADIFHFNAIDGTDGQAQSTPSAVLLDHRMHAFMTAKNGVCGANRQTQSATYAPTFVDPCDLAWRLHAVGRVELANGSPRDGSKPFNAHLTAWWTLVDFSNAFCNGFGVVRAIRVTATRALRLRQCGQKAFAQVHVVLREALPVLVGTNFLLGIGLFCPTT